MPEARADPYPRWFWPFSAAPGVLWLLVLFVVPFYAVLAVSFGATDPIFRSAVPVWNPLQWNADAYQAVVDGIFAADGPLRGVFARTLVYVFVAVGLCLVIGYPVAYYIARYGGRYRGVLLVGLLAPFWISYLMRMLAWVNLLQDDGYVNRFLEAVGIFSGPRHWLDGKPSSVVLGLVYGYIPFLILPLYAALDRIDTRLLEAARDLGASPARAFLRVTLPLSRHGILAGVVIVALPMFGDYYTPDLLSGSPNTNMIGNQIDFYLHSSEVKTGAALVVALSVLLLALMLYYLVSTSRASKEA